MARKAAKSDKIVVRVFGTPEIRVGEHRIGLSTEALFAVALYLTTRAGERVGKDELLDMFWPEGDLEARRHAMRQMMYRLRKVGISPQESGELYCVEESCVDSDLLLAVRERSTQGLGQYEPRRTSALGALFSGRLAAPFLEWFDQIRAKVALRATLHAHQQMHLARREARWADLDDWARIVLEADPFNEEAVLARAESASMAGSKHTALELLDAYLNDLGESAAELAKPAHQLRKRIAERRRQWTGRTAREVALVGRSAIMSQLTNAIEDTSYHRGTSISLVGPAGIGKTRIATEAAEIAAIRGLRVVQARAEASHFGHALGIVRELTASLLALPGALGVSPVPLQMLRGLVENGAARHPASSDDISTTEISSALLELIRRVNEEVRLLILIDDGHHVDIASREALARCVSCVGLRTLWIVTSRHQPEPWLPGTLRLPVHPLDADEASTLAERILASMGHTGHSKEPEELVSWAGGNPLFVAEMAAHRASGDSRHSVLPSSLQEAIRLRLNALDEPTVAFLRTATLLGSSATIARCTSASRLSKVDALRAAERLEQEGILFMDAQGTLGLHECWQQEVIDGIPRVMEATLCVACAETIADGLGGRLAHNDVWRAAHLFSRAGDHQRSIQFRLAAIDDLLAQGLLNEAEALVDETSRSLSPRAPRLGLVSRAAEIRLARGDARGALELTASLPSTYDTATRQGEQATDWVMSVALRFDAKCKLYPEEQHDSSSLVSAISCKQAAPAARHYAAFLGARQCVWADDHDGIRRFHQLGHAVGHPESQTLHLGFVDLLYNAELGTQAEFCASERRLSAMENSYVPKRMIRLSARYRATGLRMHGLIDEAAQLAHATYMTELASGHADVSSGDAEFMSFLLMDQNQLAVAERWIEVGLRSAGAQTNSLRIKGLRHARLRWLWQIGRGGECLELMRPYLSRVKNDPNRTRGTGEVLTYCVASAELGMWTDEVSSLARESEATLRSIPPSYLWDYPAEMLARALAAANEPRAEEVRRDLVEMRRERFNRPIAPFFQSLNADLAFPTAALSPSKILTP